MVEVSPKLPLLNFTLILPDVVDAETQACISQPRFVPTTVETVLDVPLFVLIIVVLNEVTEFVLEVCLARTIELVGAAN